ncbi:tetratricopeptide repeat protein [Breznakiella homolactica]|uniref:Tetratricopeptide repeat protein n=1 Tax=Breznakiella homolactica TaxID=2798577 RepID=A0A7T8B8W4_9SPIR|nr:tetratricopeptide repeat protein [Breznakiella homolactica]QQO09034.1 tetratricopeptide repeat protein [Breznakiella homolactica]
MKKVSLFLLFFVPAAFLAAQNLDREAFLDAEVRFLAGNYTLALESYDDFIRNWPNSSYAADARYRRGVTLYRLGRPGEAYSALSAVESRYRSTKYLPYVPFWKGVIEYDRGDYGPALARFTGLTENPPDQDTFLQSLLYQGKAATALEEYETALAAFESFFEKLRDLDLPLETDPSALIFVFDIYTRLDMPKRLTALWEQLDTAQLDAFTREQLALKASDGYIAQGNNTRALQILESAENSPRREIAVAALQRMLDLEQHRNNEAAVSAIIIRAENVLRSDPEALSDFWLQVGASAFHEGRYDLARSYFLRVTALAGGGAINPDVPIYLAEIAYREGDLPGAYQILADNQELIQGDKTLFLLRKGWYALGLEQWDRAAADLGDAHSLAAAGGRKDLADLALAYSAYALYRNDDAAAALAVLGPAGNGAPQLLSAELYKRNNRAVESLEAYTAVIERDRQSAEAHLGRMGLLFERNQYRRVLDGASEMEQFIDVSALPGEDIFAFYYMRGVSAAVTGDYRNGIMYLDEALETAESGGLAASWAEYIRAWSLYRSSRFTEAAQALSAFAAEYPAHEEASTAAYLAAWSYSNLGDYRTAAAMANRSAVIAQGQLPSQNQAESAARAFYLEGTLRPFFGDYQGALNALDKAAAVQSPASSRSMTSYTVRAAFEKGSVYYQAGQINEADRAYEALIRNFPEHALAEEAAYRRGEIMYGAGRYNDAAVRFETYRDQYPAGSFMDGALYFGGLSRKALGSGDQAILLWERLASGYPGSQYRFPGLLALARAYWDKQSWEAAFNTYTTILAEFGDRARSVGADAEAETLRYIMTGLPEQAARLHVSMNRAGGVSTPAGRSAALELARYYVTESSQRESGLSLADEVITLRGEAPGAAAEAYLLRGDYYMALDGWEQAAGSYLNAASAAADAPAGERSTEGRDIRTDLAPEALYKAAQARLRLGRRDSAAEITATLRQLYPSSPWTGRAQRLLEGN